MRELAQCLIDAAMDIGGARYRLRMPSAREAMVCYAAIEAEDIARLQQVCRVWLPARLFDRYFGPGSLLIATLADLDKLLKIGVPDLSAHERDLETIKKKAARQSMFAVLADFARQQNTPAPLALEMPWPLFVGLVAENIRLSYREKVDMAIAVSMAQPTTEEGQAKKDELWRDFMARAGYDSPEEDTFEEPDWMDDAWAARQLAKVQAINERKRAEA